MANGYGNGGLGCVWSEHSNNLKDTINENTLPTIVKISDQQTVKSEPDTPFDLHQPLLLYKELKRSKLYCRDLDVDIVKDELRYKEIGSYVVIPEEYPGLFQKVESVQEHANERTLLSTVARMMPATFLTVAPCKGFVSCLKRGGTVVYSKRKDVNPGLFYVMNIHEDYVTYINSKKSEKRRLMLCLRCISEDRQSEVLFSLDTSAKLYIVDLRTNGSKYTAAENVPRLFRINELITACQPGDRFKLIRGDPPLQDEHFTGLLKLCHLSKEHTVIACTFNFPNCKLLELSVPHGPQFTTALNDPYGKGEFVIKKYSDHIEKSVNRFVKEIKIRKDYNVVKKDFRE